MNKLYASMKYFTYGLQFTMMIIAPFVLCIFAGGYIQKKYNLGDWVVGVSIILAVIIVAADLYSFGKMILKEINEKSRGEHDDKQNH